MILKEVHKTLLMKILTYFKVKLYEHISKSLKNSKKNLVFFLVFFFKKAFLKAHGIMLPNLYIALLASKNIDTLSLHRTIIVVIWLDYKAYTFLSLRV